MSTLFPHPLKKKKKGGGGDFRVQEVKRKGIGGDGGGVDGFFLACEDFWDNTRQFIPRLRFFFSLFF